MIRLVASDLDGTLMHNDRSVPDEFYRLYAEMKRRGILFVAATGNQASTLRHVLSPIADGLTCVCDNGGRILQGDRVLHEAPVPENALLTALDLLADFPECIPVCSNPDGAFLYEHDRYRADPLLVYLQTHGYVPDLRDIPQRVFKLAICDPTGHIHRAAERLRPLLPDGVQLVTSGNGWMDVISNEATKGNGIAWLQNHLGISPAETLVFGDQMNDADMMRRADFSYAVKNADPRLFDVSKFVAPSNEDDGVVRILKQYLSD